MGDYHFVYKDIEEASTQWDDIQRKLGNLTPKPHVFKPDPFTPAEDEGSKSKDKDWIDEKIQEEVDDLEDDRILRMVPFFRNTDCFSRLDKNDKSQSKLTINQG